MSNKMLITSITLISILFLSSCSETNEIETEVKPRLVRTQILSLAATENYLEFPAEVSAAQSTELGFRIAGKLSKMNVREGDEVINGTVLAVLDDTDYAIQLQSRQAEYDNANSDFVRGQQLIEKNLIAQADFDKLKAQQVASLANLNAAKQNMIYTELKAPYDGVIARRHVDNFEDVNVMQPIYTIQDLSVLNIKVALPETIMIQTQEDNQARVRAIFDALPGQEFPLTLTSVSTEANPDSKTFEVTMSMPNIEGVTILPGMSLTVRGTPPRAEETSYIIVPSHAVIADSAGKAVFVVEGVEGDQGIINRRQVVTGELTDTGIIITEGLSEGDRIVTAGMSQISEGLIVRVSQEWTE